MLMYGLRAYFVFEYCERRAEKEGIIRDHEQFHRARLVNCILDNELKDFSIVYRPAGYGSR